MKRRRGERGRDDEWKIDDEGVLEVEGTAQDVGIVRLYKGEEWVGQC